MARLAWARVKLKGGAFYTSRHELVHVYRSTRYPYSRAVLQSYANFLGSLWHGTELSGLTVWVITPQEISNTCGSSEAACYFPAPKAGLILVPGPSLSASARHKHYLAHEYGHNIAYHRLNNPWFTYWWGPKRWATYENVCRLVATHRAFPGWETYQHYDSNPGEGWPEAFADASGYGWLGIVATHWEPSARAKELIKQDVLHPWTANTTLTFKGRIGHAKTALTSLRAPLDGTIRVRLSGPQGSVLRLRLYRRGALVKTAKANSPNQHLSETVCGERQFELQVAAVRGSGDYRLVVSRP
jgi:hypothetical protein